MMNIVTRRDQGLAPARGPRAGFPNIDGIYLHYTAVRPPMFLGWTPLRYMIKHVVGIDRYHRESRGWPSIAYNWLIDNQGRIFEGRGWTTRSEANFKRVDERYYSVCFLKDDSMELSDKAIESFFKLREVLVHFIPEAEEVWYHSEEKPTACPGEKVREKFDALRLFLSGQPTN